MRMRRINILISQQISVAGKHTIAGKHTGFQFRVKISIDLPADYLIFAVAISIAVDSTARNKNAPRPSSSELRKGFASQILDNKLLLPPVFAIGKSDSSKFEFANLLDLGL
ncbi:hypothetical protein P5V15_012449 [Pogonomyrmex californicus]